MTKSRGTRSASVNAVRRARLAACLAWATALWGGAAAAEDIEGLWRDAKPILELRYRLELVDQDGFSEDALASTLRGRFGVQSGEFKGMSILVEGEAIGSPFSDNYNSTTNGRTTYPVVADPDGIELNRLQLNVNVIPHTKLTIGRQRINLLNERFVGSAGFRQNEQTFDAVRADIKPKDLPIRGSYAFASQVNRIFGNESPMGDFAGDIHMATIAVDPPSWITGTVYAYLLDLDDAPSLSTNSYGGRLEGRIKVSDKTRLSLVGEYASQSDAGDNPNTVDLAYVHGEAALEIRNVTLLGGAEILEGDGTSGFSTPLATLHKFQGYADAFLTTPAAGVEDYYGAVKVSFANVGPLKKVTAGLWYHDFSAETGGADFGDEVDAVLTIAVTDRVDVELKYASFDGVAGPPGRDKVWFSIQFKL